ncbi:MAG: hypothetical protein H7Z41_11310 [Cytophagales bacterium]|nr:hypothetical protein [Armatimonadota bacterium]
MGAKKTARVLAIVAATMTAVLLPLEHGLQAASRIPTAPRAEPGTITGSYQRRDTSMLSVRMLPGGRRIRFALSVLAAGAGQSAAPNTGNASGELALKGSTAVFLKDRCRITLRFNRQGARLTQFGDAADCDFGSGVDATGMYRRDTPAIK